LGAKNFNECLAAVPDGVLVVLDEAYIHYALSNGLEGFGGSLSQRKNLLILAHVFESLWIGGIAHWICDWAARAAIRDE